MKKRNKFFIFLLITMLFTVSAFVYMYNDLHADTPEKNGFFRNKNPKMLTAYNQLTLNSKNYYFSELTNQQIALTDFKQKPNILIISNDLKREKKWESPYLNTRIDSNSRITFSYLYNDYIFVFDRTNSIGFRINAKDKSNKVAKTKIDALPFRKIEVINDNSFLLLSSNPKDTTNLRVVKKVNWAGRELNRFTPTKQHESSFSTDGFCAYDKKTNRIIYTYAYRGEFACMDTNLNVIYQAKTIDTVRNSNLTVRKKQYTIKGNPRSISILSKPPKVINRNIAVSDGHLFILSYLKADNESKSIFNKVYTIDVYNISNGHYVETLYIPRLNKKNLLHFRIHNNKLFALHDDFLEAYML